MTNDLKTIVDAVKSLASLVSNLASAFGKGSGNDPISQGIANRYAALLDRLQAESAQPSGQQGRTIRAALVAMAESLEEAARVDGMSDGQSARLLGKANAIRGRIAQFDEDTIYRFSADLSAAQAQDFSKAIGKGRDAAESRKALRGALNDAADLAVAAIKIAAMVAA
jgi:hypothetical protein